MQFNGNEASLRLQSNAAPEQVSCVGEINLYDDLSAFLKMSPVEQKHNLAEIGQASEQKADKHSEPAGPAIEEPVAAGSGDESPFICSDSTELEENHEQGFAEALGTSGLLAELKLGGSLPDLRDGGGVCLACGAHSWIDDLFCPSCGGFLDGLAPSISNRTCAECNLGIASDEIFCPWCGSVLTV